MVQIGTPEQYFQTEDKTIDARVTIAEPLPTLEARVVEPVHVQTQLQTDYVPIIAICFFGTICFLAFLAWMVKK